MKFIDQTTIYVKAGDGGNGCRAFRREANVPMGGPSGGDGGRGGDVVMIADSGMSTLLDLKYQREFRAQRGEHGQGSDCYGKSGEDLIIRVPCGTLVYVRDTDELLVDLVDPGDRFVIAKGGKGGAGNIHFTSSTNRAPTRADPGELGEEHYLRLELKLLANVGLVGLPNAGKSTFISSVSAARPKIADYPFTTLVPSLGVVTLGEERSLVIADIPGLIEGAHEGAGLGDRFLKHIERTQVLIYLLDDRHPWEQTEGSPLGDFHLLQNELKSFNPELGEKPTLIALNKCDSQTPERLEELKQEFSNIGYPCFFISAVTKDGIPPLLDAAYRLVKGI